MSSKGMRHTPEAKARIAAAMRAVRAADSPEVRARRAWRTGRAIPSETRAKIAASHMGLKHTPEARAKMSVAKKGRRLHSAEWRAELSRRFKGRPAPFPMRRFYYKDIAFRSSWEARTAEALDALGVRWEYESRRVCLGTQTWAPDFYLPDDGAFWEVKGYFGPKSRKTIALFRSLRPEPLVVITEQALELLEQTAAIKAAA